MTSIDLTQTEISKLITHHIGNKLRDEEIILSSQLTNIDDETRYYLLKYFLLSFKQEEFFSFTHSIDLERNDIYTIVKSIFKNQENFKKHSVSIAKLLYEQSNHPKIKEGELNIVLFDNVFLNEENTTAIGIFKSETSAPFIKMNNQAENFLIVHDFGFDLKGIDKGCIIFNEEESNGYKISIIDNSNKSGEAQYWTKDFLGVVPTKDEYHQTNQFLGITKQFVTKQLDEDFEVSKADKIDLLNRSVDYFKKHETFDKKEFEEEVFGDDNVIESFQKFDTSYRQENEIELTDSFEISGQAVKKQARAFKSVLKLDKNFHIYIHGNKELIEKGVENDGRKYYKIYYQDEN